MFIKSSIRKLAQFLLCSTLLVMLWILYFVNWFFGQTNYILGKIMFRPRMTNKTIVVTNDLGRLCLNLSLGFEFCPAAPLQCCRYFWKSGGKSPQRSETRLIIPSEGLGTALFNPKMAYMIFPMASTWLAYCMFPCCWCWGCVWWSEHSMLPWVCAVSVHGFLLSALFMCTWLRVVALNFLKMA